MYDNDSDRYDHVDEYNLDPHLPICIQIFSRLHNCNMQVSIGNEYLVSCDLSLYNIYVCI